MMLTVESESAACGRPRLENQLHMMDTETDYEMTVSYDYLSLFGSCNKIFAIHCF